MTPQEVERRIAHLEMEVDRLRRQLGQTGKNQGTKTSENSDSTKLGSMPAALKRILNLGFEWISNKVNVKAAPNAGITVAAAGVGVKVRANYGLTLDSNGLALKKQATPTAPGTVAAVVLVAGTDTIDLAAGNTVLATQATQIASLKTSIDSIITKLQSAEVVS